jgi:hypothetical protein
MVHKVTSGISVAFVVRSVCDPCVASWLYDWLPQDNERIAHRPYTDQKYGTLIDTIIYISCDSLKKQQLFPYQH